MALSLSGKMQISGTGGGSQSARSPTHTTVAAVPTASTAAAAAEGAATARAKYSSPYHVSTYQLSFHNGPKHHVIATHWQQQKALQQQHDKWQTTALYSYGGGHSAATASAAAPPSPPSASSAATAAAAPPVAVSFEDTKTSGSGSGSGSGSASGSSSGAALLQSTLPQGFATSKPVEKPAALAALAPKGGIAQTSVYASGDGAQNITKLSRSAGKFHSAKKAYRPAESTVAETAERLAKETAEYRERGLRFGSSIRNISSHQPHVEMNLPTRFADPDFFNRPLRQQHPAYRTTSNNIGHRPPNATELTKVYATRPISFTSGFNSGPYRSGGLNTSITRPRVDTKEGLNI